jgi:rsbT antagonist protein RsbS
LGQGEANLNINIQKIEGFLLTAPQYVIHDEVAESFKDEVLEKIKKTGVKGLLIDLSAIDVVDSFLGRVINEIATSSRLMGAQVVVTGLRPAVAITMVEMGLTFKNVEMAKNLDKGLLLLRKLMHGNEQMKGH